MSFPAVHAARASARGRDAPPSPQSLAAALGVFVFIVVLFACIAATWRPLMPESWMNKPDFVHAGAYVFQTFQMVFSFVIFLLEMTSSNKPHVTLALSSLACSAAVAITMIAQVAHKASLRTPGGSMYKHLEDIHPPLESAHTIQQLQHEQDTPFGWPAITFSHQGFSHWYEWLTLVCIFGGQSVFVVFSVSLSAMRAVIKALPP